MNGTVTEAVIESPVRPTTWSAILAIFPTEALNDIPVKPMTSEGVIVPTEKVDSIPFKGTATEPVPSINPNAEFICTPDKVTYSLGTITLSKLKLAAMPVNSTTVNVQSILKFR